MGEAGAVYDWLLSSLTENILDIYKQQLFV